ncbi:MAG: Mur ligase family protein [Candidatus Krumholzibacteriota bacterium]|nr:Mur ligase family protein [Candidatus Krumholzibacteriota bacterium]
MMKKSSRLSDRRYPFSNIEFLYSLRPTKMRLGLENITSLLDSLGNPQMKYPAVLVGGTNGKGSVTAYISSILRCAGLKVGTFYSPHLFRINERIRINNREIPSAALDRIVDRLRRGYERNPFTFFEGITASAALYFLQNKVDIAIFEVGLGGRLDATRPVNAVATVITGISIDHSSHLGRSRKAILGEKLGIARGGVPLIVNLDTDSLIEKASFYCRREDSSVINVKESTSSRLKKITFERMTFSLKTDKYDYGDIETRMIGKAQKINVSTAVKTIEVLGDKTGKSYVKYVKEGLEKTSLPGRFQVLRGVPRVILDTSHNQQALINSLNTLLAVSQPHRNILLFGCMARKEPGRFPSIALRSARKIILVPLKQKGAETGENLLNYFTEAGSKETKDARVILSRGMGDALRKAKTGLKGNDTILICGSHHMVDEAVSYS